MYCFVPPQETLKFHCLKVSNPLTEPPLQPFLDGEKTTFEDGIGKGELTKYLMVLIRVPREPLTTTSINTGFMQIRSKNR